MVLVEYAQNTENVHDAHALERLLRRLLQLPSYPAVVLVNLPTLRQLGGIKAAEGQWIRPLAAHYALPSFSLLGLLRANAERVDVGGRRTLAAHVNLTAGWYQCGICLLYTSPSPRDS